MCFSAEASFLAGGLLMPAGAYCIWAAVRKGIGSLPMAAIPIFFGAQQISEGFVWIAYHHHDAALLRSGFLFFLFFALAFWPFWIPLSVAILSDRPKVKRSLAAVAVFGLAFGAFIFGPLALSGGAGLTTQVIYHSLFYNLRDLPPFNQADPLWWQVVYVSIIFFPFVVSPDRRFAYFGILLVAATVISQFVFRYAFVSVWCFFAAILSLQLCYIFYRLEQPQLSQT